ncbi:MAG: DUF3089 domain-containing protein [Alphaproteobacteria bacterium]
MGKFLAAGLVGFLFLIGVGIGYQDVILFDWLYAPPNPIADEEDQGPAFDLQESSEGLVPVFFVPDTTNFDAERWNLKPGENATQLPLFDDQKAFDGDCCRLTVVQYPQAAFYATRPDAAAQGAIALDRAYAGVKAAYQAFLEKQSGQFVLAGQGHGSLLLARVLEEEGILKEMIVAYLPGVALPADYPHACKAGDQTGCVISWNGFDGMPEAQLGAPPIVLAGVAPPYLCILPWHGEDEMAYCDDQGRVRLTFEHEADLARWRAVEFPGGSFHAGNYALFFGAVRGDIARRARLLTQ